MLVIDLCLPNRVLLSFHCEWPGKLGNRSCWLWIEGLGIWLCRIAHTILHVIGGEPRFLAPQWLMVDDVVAWTDGCCCNGC